MARTDRIISKVSGVSFDNDDGSSRQKLIKKYCRNDSKLLAIPERNRYATTGKAVGLWVPTGLGGRSQIGHVSDEWADQVYKHLESGGTATVRILNVTGGTRDKPSFGVNFEILLTYPEPEQQATEKPKAKRERPASKPKPTPPPKAPPQSTPDWKMGDRLYVAGEYSKRFAGAVARGLVAGYRGLPDWAQPIAWGLGAAIAIVAFMLLFRAWR